MGGENCSNSLKTTVAITDPGQDFKMKHQFHLKRDPKYIITNRVNPLKIYL